MTAPTTGLLDRQVAFVEALRAAGLPVSLAEDLDATRALAALPLVDREAVRAGYAATLLKRPSYRPAFDTLFDLYFPALIGNGSDVSSGTVRDELVAETASERQERHGRSRLSDGPDDLSDLRTRLEDALATGDQAALQELAREGVARFGAMRGRAPGESSWSAYTALHRIHGQQLVDRIVQALLAAEPERLGGEPAVRRRVQRDLDRFTSEAEADARRRIAEQKGAAHMAKHAVRPAVELLDFTSARRADLADMRRQVQPLARRLASRLAREQAASGRGALDFRRTVRASMSTGGVPLTTRHKPRRPTRTDLVVLCDVSGSVASFAQFTLMLVHALREQFSRVRAFTFVDEVHEVTDVLTPGGDPTEILRRLVASAEHASRFGRTNYGRAFERFLERHGDALTPRANVLVLGDARSNHSDLALPTAKQIVARSRHAWWLNPEHPRHWDSGDSAASAYGAVVPMVECRNLTQLGEFVGELARGR